MRIILLSFAVILLASCGRDSSDSVWWANQRTITELKQKRELTMFRLEMLSPLIANESPVFGAISPEVLREEISSMELRKSQISDDIVKLKDEWPTFRAATLQRRRTAAMVEVTGDFHLPDGRVLRAARITGIDDGGVSVSHETGAARLRFGDLDDAMRSRFGLDGELAALAADREREERAAYDRWHEERHRANELERQRLAEAQRVEQNRLNAARLLAAASRAHSSRPLSGSIGTLGETSSVSRNIYPYKRTHYYGRSSVRYYYYQPVASRCSNGIPFWRSSNPFQGACHSFSQRPVVSHGPFLAR